MKRRVVTLALWLTMLLFPVLAQATWFGAFLQGQAGYQHTNRVGHLSYGAAGGLVFLGIELFADLRFLDDGQFQNRGWWNQAGLRYGIEIGGDVTRFEPYAGISYVYSRVHEQDMDLTDPEERKGYRGLNPHAGLRLDFILFSSPVSIGLQGEFGYHVMLSPNGLKYSDGINYAGMLDLKLSI